MGSIAAASPFAATTRRRGPQDDTPKFAPGTMVAARYRLVRYIARGGMAEVWLAMHENLKNEVAIKFIDQALAYDHVGAHGAVERFRLEAQVSARLGARTKHIVAVHDAGEHEGLPYLVMEFVPGRTLEDEIEHHGPLEPRRFADLLDQAADALSAAHALEIVHRDLKPSNMMLREEEGGPTVLKIADFGIAKALRRDPSAPFDHPKETQQGEIIGSPAYMSPEQMHGTGPLDARSDLWSLAAVAYEALTGRCCFEGRSIAEIMIAIGCGKYRPASQVRPDLPKALDGWFARALAVEPSKRWSSATEMARAFREAVTLPARRRPLTLWAAGAALIIGGSVAIFLALRSPAITPIKPIESVEITAHPSAVIAPAPPPPTPTIEVIPSASPESPPLPTARVSPPVRVAPSAQVSAAPTTTASASAPIKPPPTKKRIDPSEIQ